LLSRELRRQVRSSISTTRLDNMKKLLFLFGLLATCPLIGRAQAPAYQNVIFVGSAPTGACTNGSPAQIVISTGVLYTCQASTWAVAGGGGGGGPYLPLTGGTLTGTITSANTFPLIQVGTVAGGSAIEFINKPNTAYAFYGYDNNVASTTCCFEDFNGEVYNRTANLSALVAPYRAHIDPSNTQTADYQLFGFASGAHGDHSGGLTILADGTHGYGSYVQAMGTYNNFWQEGFPFGGVGVATITYVSGGTFAGTGSCLLTPNNNGAFNASANIAVSSGTPGAVTVLVYGQGATSAPTQAVVSNLQPGTVAGTATCSGTVTITSTLQQSVATVGTRIEHTSTGRIFDIYQGANAMSNDMIEINANYLGTGAFTGNYLNFLNNGASLFTVNPQGAIYSNAFLDMTEQAPGSCPSVSSLDIFCANSTNHRFSATLNGGSIQDFAMTATAQTFSAAQTFTGGVINTTTPVRDQTRFVLASNMTAVATAGVNIGSTGASNSTFSWPVTTANWYDLRCQLPVTFAATATIKFQLVSISGSVTVSNVNAETMGNTGAAGVFQNLATVAGTSLATSVTPVTGAPGASEQITYDAQFLTSHAGNIGLEFIANGTNNVTMLLGGECGITQIN